MAGIRIQGTLVVEVVAAGSLSGQQLTAIEINEKA